MLHPLLQAAALGRLLMPAVRAVPAVLSGTGHHAWGQQLVRGWGHKVWGGTEGISGLGASLRARGVLQSGGSSSWGSCSGHEVWS